jgi:hypothetical protein
LNEDLNSLGARLAEELSKYIYFLLAASGAAIAYALEQVEGKVLSKDLIFVILALHAWCGSFYSGVRHLHLHRQHMIENANALLADETFQQMQKRLKPLIEKMERTSNLQYVLSVSLYFVASCCANRYLTGIYSRKLMDKSELCINLWFCFDKEAGFVDAIAGRGYFLNGSDEQKTATLKILASSDFQNAEWQPIPDRYQTKIVSSVKSESELFSGVVHSSDIDILGLDLFEEVFKQIEVVNQILKFPSFCAHDV